MNILSETYIFYVDVYFIQNFIIKIAVLYLSLYCNKFYIQTTTPKWIGKIVCASGIGTIVEIIGLLLGSSYNMFLLFVHILEIPLMFLGILGKESRRMLHLVVTGFFFIVVINGIVEVLWNWFGENTSFILLLMFSCGSVIAGVHIWKNYKKMQKGIFAVILYHQDKRISTYGFYDSGNHLQDPYTGKGVHIVSENLFQSLCLESEAPVFVPFHALGSETGIVEVYYVEELFIEGAKQRIHLQKCPLGVTKENLFKDKKYEMILNEEVF